MSLPPPTEAILAEDENYNSEEDSDFDPTAAAAQTYGDDADSSDDDSDDDFADGDAPAGDKDKNPTVKKRKRTYSNDDFGGEGGLIKTRAQRAVEERGKLGGVAEGKVTTNVDDLWAQMNAEPVKKLDLPKDTPETKTPEEKEGKDEKKVTGKTAKEVLSETGERMVVIKTTYEFAGQTITEEKLVPASSETARAHLSSAPASSSPSPGPTDPTLPKRRAPPKKRTSAFDAAAASRAKPTAAPKLNTLEKSRLDWAGFVDKEGIQDDLKKFNKGEKGYLEQQAFLGRVAENRDQQWKAANKK